MNTDGLLTMDMLLIDVPTHIEDDEELADWVRENTDRLAAAMDLDASVVDDRATVDEVTITNIEIDEMSVAIHYQYDFSVYYGCRDMNYADTSEEDVIVGERHGNLLSFKKFKPRERRSTYDEF